MVVGILFVLANINNIYNNIFGDWNQGVVLLKYTIQGNKYTFMKRSVKRSIFIQIMLFSMNAVYILFKDRKMELMIFATGNIYRETGTASKEVEDKSVVRKIKSRKCRMKHAALYKEATVEKPWDCMKVGNPLMKIRRQMKRSASVQ